MLKILSQKRITNKDNKVFEQETKKLLLKSSNASIETLFEEFDTSYVGLTEFQIEEKIEKYGKNQITHEKPVSWYMMIFTNLKNPFVLILIVLGTVSYLTGDLRATIVVFVMIVSSVLMRFIQEFRSSKAAEALKSMVNTTATVTRRESIYNRKITKRLQTNLQKVTGLLKEEEVVAFRSVKQEISFTEIVPGDIVNLSAGDMIPADVRIIASKDLFISQSSLTGESMPVEKYDQESNLKENTEKDQNPLERNNLCFMGTNVISGTAIAVVITTGDKTQFGSLSKNVVGHRNLTSFDKGVNSVSQLLIKFMAVMVPVIFLVNGFVKHDWKEAFLFGIAVAVGLTPEMLPMVVTANLARGAVAMSKKKVIVKRLNAIQNLGAMDVLCTDKTGTLTQDKIILEEHLDIEANESLKVLQYAYLNSYHQTGLKNLLDRAVLEHKKMINNLHISHDYKKVDEIPFDFVRRRMSVIVEKSNMEHLLICKGAVEELFKISTKVETNDSIVPLTDDLRKKIEIITNKLNQNGLRVVTVGYKTMPVSNKEYSIHDESDLVILGFIAFLDPPKESAAQAIRALNKNGIVVKVLTGDNDIVTKKVCQDVGIKGDKVILGKDIDACSDEELSILVEENSIFAKLSPLDKARIVNALKSNGHTVGFMGDGINDAPALKNADVGISVDTATDIARESADIILLEKSLLVLEEGVIKGREVYGNIIKYIKMTASSNFGNVFSVLIASAFIPFLPMLPVHLLVQNLLYDFSQLSLPWDKMDKEFLEKPRKWDPSGIARFMFFIGPISSIFDIMTFLIMWYVFKANSESNQSLFQSGWFIEGLLSQTLIVHMIRTQKIPFIQSTAAIPVLILTTLIISVGIFIPFSETGKSIGLIPLPMNYFIWLVVILLSYCVLTQFIKTLYIKKFKSWL